MQFECDSDEGSPKNQKATLFIEKTFKLLKVYHHLLLKNLTASAEG